MCYWRRWLREQLGKGLGRVELLRPQLVLDGFLTCDCKLGGATDYKNFHCNCLEPWSVLLPCHLHPTLSARV